MKIPFVLPALLVGMFVSLISAPIFAVPVRVRSENWDTCDDLFVPEASDELGIGASSITPGMIGPFPADEEISARSFEEHFPVCHQYDDPDMVDSFVEITNLTDPKRSFKALWYVGNPNTHLSNVDGVVYQVGHEDLGYGKAFRIDREGMNKPLLSESINPNGIFEPGETWSFVIQDFVSGGPAAGAADLASIGVAGGSLVGLATYSSGSIIGVPVPEPTCFGLMFLGMAGSVLVCRRSKK